MYKHRLKARIDKNQPAIVEALESIPGVSVEKGHDDLLVGRNGITYWYEIKSDLAVSKKTGKIKPSKVKDSQKRLRAEFRGHYKIVSSIEEILEDMGIHGKPNS